MKLFIITVIQDKIDLKSKTCEKVHTVVKKKNHGFWCPYTSRMTVSFCIICG